MEWKEGCIASVWRAAAHYSASGGRPGKNTPHSSGLADYSLRKSSPHLPVR